MNEPKDEYDSFLEDAVETDARSRRSAELIGEVELLLDQYADASHLDILHRADRSEMEERVARAFVALKSQIISDGLASRGEDPDAFVGDAERHLASVSARLELGARAVAEGNILGMVKQFYVDYHLARETGDQTYLTDFSSIRAEFIADLAVSRDAGVHDSWVTLANVVIPGPVINFDSKEGQGLLITSLERMAQKKLAEGQNLDLYDNVCEILGVESGADENSIIDMDKAKKVIDLQGPIYEIMLFIKDNTLSMAERVESIHRVSRENGFDRDATEKLISLLS